MLKKLIAIIFVLMLIITWLQGWALVLLGIVVLIFLIRIIADLFWWGKDNGKW